MDIPGVHIDRTRLAHMRKGVVTVTELEQRLRKMLGHVGKKDRQTVLDAIEAIHELDRRLLDATARLMARRDDRVEYTLKQEDPLAARGEESV